MPKEGWDYVGVRKADRILTKLEKLEKAIARELGGVNVKRADVMRVIVDEAIEKRGLK